MPKSAAKEDQQHCIIIHVHVHVYIHVHVHVHCAFYIVNHVQCIDENSAPHTVSDQNVSHVYTCTSCTCIIMYIHFLNLQRQYTCTDALYNVH